MVASFGRHINRNLWVWTLLALAVAGLASLARTRVGGDYHLGDLVALALMFAGTTLCLIGQRGLPPVEAAEDLA